VALDEGVFGRFDDAAKRKWAEKFADDILQDATVRMTELPYVIQHEMYTHSAVINVHLLETALNHFRFHMAGMAFRPAMLKAPDQ
jgi:hypothetical protein